MIDASKIIGKLSEFKFGSLEYDCVSLNRMEKDHPEVISLSLI